MSYVNNNIPRNFKVTVALNENGVVIWKPTLDFTDLFLAKYIFLLKYESFDKSVARFFFCFILFLIFCLPEIYE